MLEHDKNIYILNQIVAMSFKVRLVAGKTGLHATTRTCYIKTKDKQKYTSTYIRLDGFIHVLCFYVYQYLFNNYFL